ncbi:MAG TPA: phenylalanine--tRNA ligase subunit alpha [Phycisphaerales bacterium]|nr:phenylalanine--tRNA ligase subunit alpha [Phycisphaerales bacterium]HMP36414.1 phenylalanine--tRNA ligase subunit alpha [Phycisphaerales bacterium]
MSEVADTPSPSPGASAQSGLGPSSLDPAALREEALSALRRVAPGEAPPDVSGLEAWRVAWLGANGRLRDAMTALKAAPRELRPALGKALNELKSVVEAAFEEVRSRAGAAPSERPAIDVTEPGIPAGLGRRHVLTRTIDEIVDVFGRMGFSVATGPEVEDEFHNFIALNIPPGHPARDAKDNFYMEGPAGEIAEGSRRLLRSQTSTIQIRAMRASPPPLKVVAVGRVYRPDAHDATHYSMFHQIEGLCVDRSVTMVDLKTTLFQFARAYFGEGAEVRMRPSFFPFTEPSAEVDMKMRIRGEWRWVELGGCGMVDPNVFAAVGIDPEEWTGFAFGLGVERIAMRRYGIADIRWLFENDARFLRQF